MKNTVINSSVTVKWLNQVNETNITYYDASFIALAKLENAQLVTDNPKHQGKTTEVKVIALQDY